MPYYSQAIAVRDELKQLAIADLVLSVAFTLVFVGGLGGLGSNLGALVVLFPVALIAVTLSFVLHEYMHKLVAQHYGAVAGFVSSTQGLAITLISSMFGFLFGLPGATMIFAHNFTKRQEGIVSLAGPMTNFVVFLVFFAIANLMGIGTLQIFSSSNSFLSLVITRVLYISVIIAFFNMLPIYPLDGSKVLRWNKYLYIAVLAVVFFFMYLILPPAYLLLYLVIMVFFALIASFLTRAIF